MCGQRTKVKTAHFPGHKVFLVREMITYMISYQIQDSSIFKTSPMKMGNNGGRVFIF
jgi:hypothetical protein